MHDLTKSRVARAAIYLSVTVSAFLVVLMTTGMVAFFAKRFYGIEPKWMFGLFN